MHLHAENTWVLDITPEPQEILMGMRKQTRYSVRKSLEAGLTLEITKDAKATIVLYDLQKDTVERHGFVGFSKRHFQSELASFGADDQAALFICKKKKEPIAAALIVFYGECAYYHYSGSSTKHLHLPSSYFLQWHIIQEAKKRGCKYYNFWGIAPDDNPKHRFAGVTTFLRKALEENV